MKPWRDIAGDPATGLLITADHACAGVPDGIDLGVPPAVMRRHVAVDLGVAPLAEALCARLACPGILGAVSRLVIDYNREEDAAGLIPLISDGDPVPGNADADRAARIARYWRPYHARIASALGADRPRLLVSLHSFTPALRDGARRPWQLGILYNRDERGARAALRRLAASDLVIGDNQPYSGRDLNATMNRHAEANAIPYLGLEVRQDQLADADGIARWCDRLAPLIAGVAADMPA